MANTERAVRKKANFLLVLFIFAFVIVLVSVNYLGLYSLKSDRIHAEHAVFDFKNAVSLKDTNRYYLRGDWEFYYRSFLHSDADAPKTPSAYLPVPSSFAGNPLKHSPYKSGGHASYRAYIKNFNYEGPVAIYVPNLGCAYRVFVDGQLVTESGIVSSIGSQSWSTPASSRQKIYLTPERHEIIIELSAEGYSGLYLTPIITPFGHAAHYEDSAIAVRYGIAGIILYAAVVLLCISLFSKQRYFSPGLPILFLCLALRILISTEGFIASQPWLFSLSYERMALLTFASTFVIKLVSILYFKDELNLSFPIESMAFLSSIFILSALGVAFLPNSVYNNYYFVILQLVSTVADLYLVNQLCQSFAKGNENAATLTLAYFFMLLGITLDAVYTNGLLPHLCSYLLPFCLAAFALLLTLVHTRRSIQIYNRAQKAKELEREVEKANMSVMISQIQPHFLYNALNTIKSLIRRDPKTAEKAVIDFSYYLRGNMDSLSQTEPVPFRTELEHVKYYCNIELLRFSDKLEVIYDIKEQNFTVPTLGVQPIVENAIKHGVTKKPEGGYVRLSTYSEENDYIIRVEDNGIGFDTNALPKDDGRSHVGIENIRSRFETMLHASLQIESTPNVGTTVTIRIPKQQPTDSELPL